MKKHYRNRYNSGVTLLELVFVLAVFSIIIIVMVSIFVSIIQQQKRTLGEQEMLNQISYIMEYIGRQGRMAILGSTGGCLGGSFVNHYYALTHYNVSTGFYQGLKFISSDNNCYEFFLDTDGALKEIKNGGAAQNIVSSTVGIAYARFVINGDKTLQGAIQNNAAQPRITFSFLLRMQRPEGQKEEIFQTTISQRNLKQF